MINLKEKQKELDERKYNSSILARTDMAGKMDYCKGCIFRNDKHECEITHETRRNHDVCARQFYKIEKENENATTQLTIQPRKTGKRSNGKS